MSLVSESTIKETVPDLSKLFFEKEYINYNYTPRVMSESVNYPITFVFIPMTEELTKDRLKAAAKALYSDYAEDDELTIFTSLDTEDFHEKR